jgi:hypothetical protein
MAGNASDTALLDACVLHPIVTCDALMSLASTGPYAAKWSRRIEHEWLASLEARRPALRGKLFERRDLMREAVPDREVHENAWRRHARGLELADPDDVHVLQSPWQRAPIASSPPTSGTSHRTSSLNLTSRRSIPTHSSSRDGISIRRRLPQP